MKRPEEDERDTLPAPAPTEPEHAPPPVPDAYCWGCGGRDGLHSLLCIEGGQP